MTMIKFGEINAIGRIENVESCLAAIDESVLNDFRKTALSLKRIAPKAEDFLYFSAVMMHAAEASSLNDDGTPKLNRKGEVVSVGWDKSGGTWRWKTNDNSIKPYRNSNGDIFPEEELVKAYKKWKDKPLCIDHKSSSVEFVRGFIVDTYYDRNLKRVIALCALDKKNHPSLARQVETGYSNNVSMGTAVGRAICTECATVARTEADFCDHMRRKNAWGEINIDLSPIELSIVVNGADPSAKIKHIIASANTLNSYLEEQEAHLNKIASKEFSASLNFKDGNQDSGSINISSLDLDTFKKDLNEALEKLSDISSEINSTEETMIDDMNHAQNQTSGTVAMNESEMPNTDLSLAPPDNKFASLDKEALAALHEMTEYMGAKINVMQLALQKLTSSSNTQEEKMKKVSYYQGTEEPTPGQAQYPKDPTNEKLRMEDKHMVGQMDMGPVDGMHPGPDSVPMSELARKEMLARATAEERSLRRQAIVNAAKQAVNEKRAYFQNTDSSDKKENPGTPTPGSTKYAPEKDDSRSSNSADKHMHGQKPFPGVGSVDGLHPSPDSAEDSDEKKRKEKLSRAGRLHGHFVKASKANGALDIANSAWEISLGDKILLTASVKDISGNRSEAFYDKIATVEFGKRLIDQVKTAGADEVKKLLKKSAQAAMPAPEAAPAPALPLEGAEAPVEDPGTAGETEQNVQEKADEVKDALAKLAPLASDVAEGLSLMEGEQAQMGNVATDPLAATAAFSDRTLLAMRKEINASLVNNLKEALANLNDNEEELEMISSLYERGAVGGQNTAEILNVTASAVKEANANISDAMKIMVAFAKYARGTKALVKRAELEQQLSEMSEGDDMKEDSKLLDLIDQSRNGLSEAEELFASDSEESSDEEDENLADVEPTDEELADLNDADGAIEVKTPQQAVEVSKSNPEAKVTLAGIDTKEGRAALRYKLAADAVKYSPMLGQAHPKGGTTPDLDVKPTGDLARVEDLEEQHSAILDVATAPVKIRKDAAEIDKLIKSGKLSVSDFPELIANGADKDAIAFWKKYYGQTDGGSEFATELVKEHAQAAAKEELNVHKVKLKRAYALANQMVAKGMCASDEKAIDKKVDEIMGCNDQGFASLASIVESRKLTKAASHVPQVGIGSEMPYQSSEENLFSDLTKAFNGSRKGGAF